MRKIDLKNAHKNIKRLKAPKLRDRISKLQESLSGVNLDRSRSIILENAIDKSLFESALVLKKISSQIDEVMHATGILLSLSYILKKGELIEKLSLGAGNTGVPFDLETDRRIAEYKFIHWNGGPESIRQNGLFKDFYKLAEYKSEKKKYLYVVGGTPKNFLANSNRNINGVLNDKLWRDFKIKYKKEFLRVNKYYQLQKKNVSVVDLKEVMRGFFAVYDEIV